MPTPTTPPGFKKNDHHYVPRFWLRGFRDSANQIWKRREGKVTVTGQSHLMSADWLYTIFDDWWRPSDALEDAFAGFEGTASETFKRTCVSGGLIDENDWRVLIEFLGLTVCRHPDAMRRGHHLGKELSWMLADVHSFADRAAFVGAVKTTFGVQFPEEFYGDLRALPEEELLEVAELIEGLIPQDPQLPEQEAIKATIMVGNTIAAMDLEILDAPVGRSFLLGDRPLPLKDLGRGFSVPLSSSVALMATPAAAADAVQDRRFATGVEVDNVNAEQYLRSNAVVIAIDPAVLQGL